MALNKECVGKEYPPVTTEVTLEALQKYARAYNDDNPFYFDEHKPGGIVAPPMFGVVVTWQSVMGAVADPQVKADLLRLLHGEQDMEFFRPMRPGDVLSSKAKILSIDEKATGETMVVELTASNKNDEPVQRILFTVFIRGGGGSGKTGVAEQRTPEAQRSILFEVNQTIDKDQTYRYAEASGDRNPIHVDLWMHGSSFTGERQWRASYSCPPDRVSPGNLTEGWRRARKRVKLARHSTHDRRSILAHLTHVTHSQMLETRRRRKRGKKDLAGMAKRAKKAKKQNAKKAGAGAPKSP